MIRIVRFILLTLLTVGLFACESGDGNKTRTSTSPEVEDMTEETVTETEVAPEAEEAAEEAAEAEEEEHFDPYANMPKPKSDEELRLLREQEGKALAGEKAYFGTPRLVEWISGLGEDTDEDGFPVYQKLTDEQFGSLTVKEYIYYYLFYAESWDQVCAEAMVAAGEVKALSRELPYDMSGDYQSDRQSKSLKNNVDSVDYYLLDCIQSHKMASTDMLRMVVMQDLVDAIPSLIEGYREQLPRNDLYLTTMIELMTQAKYDPWAESDLEKSFGDAYWATIELNEVNADKVIYYAKNFAAGK